MFLSYLVGIVCSSGSSLALLARGELGEVTVVVTLPIESVRYIIQNRPTLVGSVIIPYILW